MGAKVSVTTTLEISSLIKPVLLLGAGGHAKVILEILLSLGAKIEAVVSPKDLKLRELATVKHLRSDEGVLKYSSNEVVIVNAIGSLPNQDNLRYELYQRFSGLGYRFPCVVSSAATLSKDAKIGDGVQILHGAIVNPGSDIGDSTIINTGAIVEHDVFIDKNCHIAPGAIVCGDVSIGSGVHIGAGATIIQGVTIGDGVIVGAGSVVTRDLASGSIHYPARSFTTEGI